jgi:hypothetical protein
MIKFIVAEEKQEKQLTLLAVEEDQFFVDGEGRLCQKVGEEMYNIITDGNRVPLAGETVWCDDDIPVVRILPKVTRIEF